MADLFRRHQNLRVGIGGLHCQCCNNYHGKDRVQLNRIVRHAMKQDDIKEIQEELIEEFDV